MDESEVARFKRLAIKSKRELIRALDAYIANLRDEDSFLSIDTSRISSVENLMKVFKEKIESSDLRFLDAPFEQYEITITDVDIALDIAEYEELVFDAEGNIDRASSVATPAILSVRAPFIPLEEYAALQGVRAATVLRWISTGKIKNVEKRDSGWYVASTQSKPSKDFDSGTFMCERESGDLSDVAPLANGTTYLTVHRASVDVQDGIEIEALDSNERLLERRLIDKELYREIEDGLLAATNVLFESTLIDAITEKAPLRIGGHVSAPTTMEQIEDALAHIEMPDKTRLLFDLIVNSVKSEELLLGALQELGLSTELKVDDTH